ncbi:50S ribosomal protein L18e [Candidatus Micrarchaeota archaeon RBG_16_49_10]|nr:MAG: 50S ribosomal protein L18e [Candidatus Micrarchaeota archaeon RBG_16_49_10]
MSLIQQIRKKAFETNSDFLKDLAEKLNKPRRKRVEVNLVHIDRNTEKGETVVVPGIVLGYGNISKPLSIYAWKFSNNAEEKIASSKGKAMPIEELLEKNPKGTKVRIMC